MLTSTAKQNIRKETKKSFLSNASPTRESENNRPAAQGAVGELRAEASNLITMRDLIGQRTISAKFKHVYQKFFLLFCYHRFHDKRNRITTSKVRKRRILGEIVCG